MNPAGDGLMIPHWLFTLLLSVAGGGITTALVFVARFTKLASDMKQARAAAHRAHERVDRLEQRLDSQDRMLARIDKDLAVTEARTRYGLPPSTPAPRTRLREPTQPFPHHKEEDDEDDPTLP